MRWTALALGVIFAACGAHGSKHSGDTPAPTGGAGGTGNTSAGGVGENGGSGEESGFENSPACAQYEGETDLLAACNDLLAPRNDGVGCPADFATAIAGIPARLVDEYYASVGCGLTSVVIASGLSATEFTFDSTGTLVAYYFGGDTQWGPCGDLGYQRGPRLDACTDTRNCALAPDAATVDEACRCACPDPAPSNGIAQTDEAACVYRPGPYGFQCQDKLSDWVVVGAAGAGNIHRGCNGWTQVEWQINGDDLRCVYDGSEALAGVSRTGTSGCAGVSEWQTGETYPACLVDSLCTFGFNASPASTSPCTNYPFFQ